MNFYLKLIFILILSTSEGMACTVVDEPDIEESFKTANEVILAKVISTRLVPNPDINRSHEKEVVEASFEVIEIFKGNPEPKIARENIWGPGNCTLGLNAGNIYLFYLYGNERKISSTRSELVFGVNTEGFKPTLKKLRELKAIKSN